jgi:hypothetical protein
MPWYKIFARHGPGHQSNSTFYEWRDRLLDRSGRKALWQDYFANYEYDYPIGQVRLIAKLPEDIHRSKIIGCKANINHSRKLLSVLKRTPTFKPRVKKFRLRKRNVHHP